MNVLKSENRFFYILFTGKRSEDIQMQYENTLKGHYSQCIRNLSVGDVATLRGRSRQPVHSTAKKDSDAHLLRYNSIQSLSTTDAKYMAFLPSSHVACTLRPQSRTTTELVYAAPIQMELQDDGNDVDTPPPLPPPPFDFQFAASSSEVIPITTKHRTYANVSEAVHVKSADAVESSFRPGENACLSSTVGTNSLVTDASVPVTVAAAGNGSGEVESRSSLAHRSLHSNASSSLSLSSPGSSSLLGLSPSVSTSCSTATHLLPPLAPVSSTEGVGLVKNLPPLPTRGARQAGGLRVCSEEEPKSFEVDGNGSRAEAISVHHNLVNGADVEVTNDHVQLHQPPRHPLHKASWTEEGKHMMVAPLKIVRERPQVARITKRSHENVVDSDANTTSVDANSAASEDAESPGFLFLAERARQEYIKRRSSVGCNLRAPGTSVVEHHQLTTQPHVTACRHHPPIRSGEYESVVAEKAVERVTAASGASVNRCHKDAVPAADVNHRMVRNSLANEQCLLPRLNYLRLNQNQYYSEALQKPGVREHTAIPASVLLSGKTSLSSEYGVSELEPLSDGLIILPPPLDFAECNGGNLPNTDLCSSTLALDNVLPPPPPEFNDSPNNFIVDFRCRPVATWSVNDVTRWLESIQMAIHCDSFVAHSVDGRRLVELGRSELITLGVSQVGQRMNLERAIKRAVISMPSCL